MYTLFVNGNPTSACSQSNFQDMANIAREEFQKGKKVTIKNQDGKVCKRWNNTSGVKLD